MEASPVFKSNRKRVPRQPVLRLVEGAKKTKSPKKTKKEKLKDAEKTSAGPDSIFEHSVAISASSHVLQSEKLRLEREKAAREADGMQVSENVQKPVKAEDTSKDAQLSSVIRGHSLAASRRSLDAVRMARNRLPR